MGSTSARHLMLLTRNNAALSVVFDVGILAHRNTEVLFGSDFPADKTDLQALVNLQRIKNAMATGVTVVLVHCEALYESLYDLLNQHYIEYNGNLYVRLAFGSQSKLCPIRADFRVVVVVEKLDAYTRLAPPLLNRFEKQVVERRHLLLAGSPEARVAALRSVRCVCPALLPAPRCLLPRCCLCLPAALPE